MLRTHVKMRAFAVTNTRRSARLLSHVLVPPSTACSQPVLSSLIMCTKYWLRTRFIQAPHASSTCHVRWNLVKIMARALLSVKLIELVVANGRAVLRMSEGPQVVRIGSVFVSM